MELEIYTVTNSQELRSVALPTWLGGLVQMSEPVFECDLTETERGLASSSGCPLDFPKSVPLVLLLTAFVLCLHGQADAAKITTTKAANTSMSHTNSSNAEPISATEKPTVPSTVAVLPAGAITEAKSAHERDTEVDSSDNDDDDDDDNDDDADEQVDASKPSKSATALTPAEKDDDTTSTFSVWGMVRNVWNWIKDDLSESLFGDENAEAAAATKALVRQVRDVSDAAKAAVESRTFGKIRRLQMALIPLIFKFGVLTAMVAFLIMLGMKTLFLVKLLVLMNAAAILAKFITLKSNFVSHEHSAPTWNYQSWTPHASGGWAASAPAATYSHAQEHQPTKEIHLHIHGGQVQGYGAGGQGSVSGGHGWESRSDPYGTYAPTHESEADNELNNRGPMLPSRYPTNQLY
ncbi:uncharacterized protein LOC129241947 [Anastrepha obliqua]|uniref:uncharacterized protein LOC129241947 n=1 Tax=Anastrepha obliqua TaxID=95512 RepID=UPI002409F987|nr:uncharacterized protein LOC129241947 [Anastrepha obliqua]